MIKSLNPLLDSNKEEFANIYNPDNLEKIIQQKIEKWIDNLQNNLILKMWNFVFTEKTILKLRTK